MIAICVVAALLAITAIFLLLSARIFTEMVTHPKVMSPEQSAAHIEKHGFTDPYAFLEGYKVQDFTYRSDLGYDLRGKIIFSNANSIPNAEKRREKAVILVHGFTGNMITMFPYAKIYLALGFNVFMYDHRGHGTSDKNEKTFCSMGQFETHDLIGITEYLKKFMPEDCIWGLQGESMGSATVMQAAPDIPGLSFIVEDCGFSCMEKQMEYSLKGYHLPSFPFLDLGKARFKRKYGIDMEKVNAKESVKRITVPMLFCHGDVDTFVPTDMVHELYDAKPDKKSMQLFKGSWHAMDVLEHPQQYAQTLSCFFREYGIF